LQFSSTEGRLMTRDGTNTLSFDTTWSEDDDLISVVRWDDTADTPNGYLHIVNKKNAVWDLNAGNEIAFDGAFILGTKLWLNYTNELPIAIEKIVIYDTYLSDELIEVNVWDNEALRVPPANGNRIFWLLTRGG